MKIYGANYVRKPQKSVLLSLKHVLSFSQVSALLSDWTQNLYVLTISQLMAIEHTRYSTTFRLCIVDDLQVCDWNKEFLRAFKILLSLVYWQNRRWMLTIGHPTPMLHHHLAKPLPYSNSTAIPVFTFSWADPSWQQHFSSLSGSESWLNPLAKIDPRVA